LTSDPRPTRRRARPASDAGAAETAEPHARSPRATFGALFFFCIGALAAKLVDGALPPFFVSAFALFVYAGIATSVALAYRRFVRRAIDDRRRERARREAHAGPHPEP
jgi:hypothetical protein